MNNHFLSFHIISINKLTNCGISVFVDNHCNKYSQLESQTIREAERSSRSVSWLAAEFAGPQKGNCVAVSRMQSLLNLKRAFVRSGWLTLLLSGREVSCTTCGAGYLAFLLSGRAAMCTSRVGGRKWCMMTMLAVSSGAEL
jgi:hypothetical protein